MLNYSVLLTVSLAVGVQHILSQDVTLTSNISQDIELSSLSAYDGWSIFEGAARTVAFGADGSLWSLGIDEDDGGFGIYKWSPSQNTWKYMYGSANRIAVDPLGNAWIITKNFEIYRWTSFGWESVPGSARDISIGGDGNVWILVANSTNGTNSSYEAYSWNDWNQNWTSINATGVSIAAGPANVLLLTNNQSQILSWDGSNWDLLPGTARQVAVGADGTIYRVGLQRIFGGRQTFRWDSSTNDWFKLPVGASQIAVDPNGNPTFVNSFRQIIQYDPAKLVPCNYESWELLPGPATDVGIGTDDSLWIVGNEATTGGYKIYRWVPITMTWWETPQGGVSVTVDNNGNAWIVDDQSSIYRWTGLRWEKMPGTATDIVAGPNDSMWIVSTVSRDNGYVVYRWLENTETWVDANASAVKIAVDPNNELYIVTDKQDVLRWVNSSWVDMNMKANDIVVGRNGVLYAIGTNTEKGGYQIFRYEEATLTWELLPGEVGAVRFDVDKYGNPYVVNDFQQLLRPKC